MNADEITFLKEFDSPQIVEAACRGTYGQQQSRHFAVPAMVRQYVNEGLLIIQDGGGPIVTSDRVYCRDLMLSDKGRELVGLPKVVRDAPKRKAAARTLFD